MSMSDGERAESRDVFERAEEMVTVPTPPCIHCGKGGQVTVRKAEWDAWVNDDLPVQQAMRSASADDREQLISGTHPECWTALFGNE